MATEKTRIENAIIMAAGFSSRFAPLSYEMPKALIKVKGEVLIERQITQLKEAGIHDITLVVGYKAEMFNYLKEKFQVEILLNDEYRVKNNISTLYKVRDRLKNTLICSADNYFTQNPFLDAETTSYYSSIYVSGETEEWCLELNDEDFITDVTIGGEDAWIMIGHAFFNEEFSKTFVEIMEREYPLGDTAKRLWEDLYKRNQKDLPMKIKKFEDHIIEEFDSLEDLREFDESYGVSSGSKILSMLKDKFNCEEKDIREIEPLSRENEAVGFRFTVKKNKYKYTYANETLEEEPIER